MSATQEQLASNWHSITPRGLFRSWPRTDRSGVPLLLLYMPAGIVGMSEWVMEWTKKYIEGLDLFSKSFQQNIFQINTPSQTAIYLSLDGETGEWRESLAWSPRDCSRLIASCVGLLLTLLTVDPLIPLGGPVFSGLLGGVGGGVKIGSEAL